MSDVKITKPSQADLARIGIDGWNPWECEPSEFDWEYDTQETFYVLEGLVKVSTGTGEVEFGKGDLVTFARGVKCRWHVIEKIRKVYRME